MNMNFRQLTAVVVLVLCATDSVARGPRPVNDDQAAAVAISVLPFSATVDVSRVTRDPNDPGPYCFDGGTVWYSFTSADRRMLTASTIGSEVPAGLEVYRQTDSGLQLVTCAYDFQTFASAFQVEPATTYFFMAGATAASATRGTIAVSIDTYGAPPAHDVKAGALYVTPGTTLVSDSTAATNDSDDFPGYSSGRATVWHRFVPTSDGRYSASVNADGFYPALNVGEQTASGVVPLGFISGPDLPAFFEVNSNQTYYLLVGNETGFIGGPYRLTVAAAPPVLPTVTIDRSGSIDRGSGGAVISGTVTCSEAANFRLGVIVTQRDVQGSVFPAEPISCGTTPVQWSATVLPGAGAYGGGPANVRAGGTAYTQFDNGSAETSAKVTLSGR
jgi:hypothetical protein